MKEFFKKETLNAKGYQLFVDTDIVSRIPEMKSAKGSVRNGLIGVSPTLAGQRLMYDYYHHKYSFKAKIIFSDSNDPHLSSTVAKFIKSIQESNVEGRFAFSISGLGNHTAPLIYIKEGKEEGIFYADSLGNVMTQSQEINALTKIPVYTASCRQMDSVSCHTDTMVFLRQAVGKNANNEYIVPNLLASLKERATLQKNETGECYIAKLPDGLLITAQSRRFIDEHRDPALGNKAPIVHRHQTLNEFRARYNKETETRSMEEKLADLATLNIADRDQVSLEFAKEKKGMMNLYLHQKGIKIADTMEIQFYLNQIEAQLHKEGLPSLTIDQKKEFIAKAKTELKQQGSIADNVNKEPLTVKRLGLYGFATKYLMDRNTADKTTSLCL